MLPGNHELSYMVVCIPQTEGKTYSIEAMTHQQYQAFIDQPGPTPPHFAECGSDPHDNFARVLEKLILRNT